MWKKYFNYLVIFISIYAPLSIILNVLVFLLRRYRRAPAAAIELRQDFDETCYSVSVTSAVHFGRAHVNLDFAF